MSLTIFKQLEQNRVPKSGETPSGKASHSPFYEPGLYSRPVENSTQNDSCKNLSGSDAIVMILNASGKLMSSAENLKQRGNSKLNLEQLTHDLMKFRQCVLNLPAEVARDEQNSNHQGPAPSA